MGADTLIGNDVYNAANESLGTIKEMMIEMRWAGAAAQKPAKLFLGGSGRPARPARGRVRGPRKAFGDGNGAAIGKLKLILPEATSQGQARNFKSVFQAVELFFLDGK